MEAALEWEEEKNASSALRYTWKQFSSNISIKIIAFSSSTKMPGLSVPSYRRWCLLLLPRSQIKSLKTHSNGERSRWSKTDSEYPLFNRISSVRDEIPAAFYTDPSNFLCRKISSSRKIEYRGGRRKFHRHRRIHFCSLSVNSSWAGRKISPCHCKHFLSAPNKGCIDLGECLANTFKAPKDETRGFKVTFLILCHGTSGKARNMTKKVYWKKNQIPAVQL